MTIIMLFHVRSKYTAVGRKEIVLFFYIYMFVELLAIFLDSTIIPTANAVYPVSLLICDDQAGSDDVEVVCRSIRRCSRGALLVHPHQPLCWLPIPRRWHADELMGMSSRPLTVSLLNTLSFSAYRASSFGASASSSPSPHSRALLRYPTRNR